MTAQEFTTSIIDLKGNLQKYALSLTLDRDNALDLVQDTFL
ncbi:MAG: RNA polymerase sigma factor, partial [Bacteroidales bacterium]|nr:RNA polymerase sigma factor [Bacteroidales bacterium]